MNITNYVKKIRFLLKGGFKEDIKGSVNVPKTMQTLILVAILLPIGIAVYLDTNTTGWDTIWVTVWDLIPLMAILAVAMAFIYKVRTR